MSAELSAALLALNEGNAEQWRVRWAKSDRSDGRKCWRLENEQGHLRAEIHQGGDVLEDIYYVHNCSCGLDVPLQLRLEVLARVLWTEAVEQTT
jgi:hypothetical protein